MRGRVAVIIMTALLALYLAFIVNYAVVLLGTGSAIGIAMGVALLVIPIIGVWVIVREVVFVIRGEKLLARLRAEGGLPTDDLPRLPSGRVVAEAADKEFPRFKEAVENNPDSWRAWVLLALAYDASGDRPRARWATRQAISIERTFREA